MYPTSVFHPTTTRIIQAFFNPLELIVFISHLLSFIKPAEIVFLALISALQTIDTRDFRTLGRSCQIKIITDLGTRVSISR